MQKEFQHITLSPLTPHIGAEITRVNLAEPISAEMLREINEALLLHLVIFFRDQSLNPRQMYAAACQFGAPTPYPFVSGIDDFPEIIEVLKLPDEKENFGGVWHSDTSYLPSPTMGALLYAKQIPASGGDTLFSNMYLAYESLSPGLQKMLSSLRAISNADKSAISQSRINRKSHTPKDLRAIHPVIRTHPETKRKLLYINRAHTTHFEGMSIAESKDLLEHLYQVQASAEFSCRFRWSQGSVAFWDNRACQHYPLNDYAGHRRLMHRISLAGDVPY
ncbi:MAG: TauD/TfdA family dioxygenase [Pseudomonadales bacterium]